MPFDGRHGGAFVPVLVLSQQRSFVLRSQHVRCGYTTAFAVLEYRLRTTLRRS
ncbi:hypothetical protein [Acetobacter nitrogenifigens]|uniref:hypothetical protein n=1 Tax=Acetobacter nitrogenifigens TaxID=285268 RepID=UPI0003FC5FA3|nr:hypothetical protein [Acetobacter nitrogenifigens]